VLESETNYSLKVPHDQLIILARLIVVISS